MSGKVPYSSFQINELLQNDLSPLQRGLPVSLIATVDPACCRSTDSRSQVLEAADFADFDFIPVKHRESEHIVGVLEKVKARQSTGSVSESMTQLHPKFLMSDNAAILSFLTVVDEQSYCLVLSENRIHGIVTYSDLQKVPVRPAVFTLITFFEILLAEWIRKYHDSEAFLKSLKENDSEKLDESFQKKRNENNFVDVITLSDLRHKIRAAVKLGLFTQSESGTLGELYDLRCQVAHSAGLADSKSQIRNLSRLVQKTIKYIKLTESELSRNP